MGEALALVCAGERVTDGPVGVPVAEGDGDGVTRGALGVPSNAVVALDEPDAMQPLNQSVASMTITDRKALRFRILIDA